MVYYIVINELQKFLRFISSVVIFLIIRLPKFGLLMFCLFKFGNLYFWICILVIQEIKNNQSKYYFNFFTHSHPVHVITDKKGQLPYSSVILYCGIFPNILIFGQNHKKWIFCSMRNLYLPFWSVGFSILHEHKHWTCVTLSRFIIFPFNSYF